MRVSPSFRRVHRPLTSRSAGMATVVACGGDDSTTGDAGPDVTTQDVAKDVTPDVKPDADRDASCANDVDLTQFLPSADASIDVDAGGLEPHRVHRLLEDELRHRHQRVQPGLRLPSGDRRRGRRASPRAEASSTCARRRARQQQRAEPRSSRALSARASSVCLRADARARRTRAATPPTDSGDGG